MPSWGIHLYVADKLLSKLNVDKNEFLIGNVLPDVLVGWIVENPSKLLSYDMTHFGEKIEVGKYEYTLPNYEKYIKEVNDSLTLGYFVHLLTDYYFNRYTFENKFVKDGKKDEVIGINSNSGFCKCDSEQARILKQKEFKMYEDSIVKQLNLHEFNILDNSLEKLLKLGYSKEDIYKTCNVIKSINNVPEQEDNDFVMFNYDELKKVTENSIIFIIQNIKNVI